MERNQSERLGVGGAEVDASTKRCKVGLAVGVFVLSMVSVARDFAGAKVCVELGVGLGFLGCLLLLWRG